MTILFKTSNMKGEIVLGEDAIIEDCVDALVAAMIAEGYEVSGIADTLHEKSKSLETSTDKYC